MILEYWILNLDDFDRRETRDKFVGKKVNVIKCNVNPTLPANNFVFLRSTYVIITNN